MDPTDPDLPSQPSAPDQDGDVAAALAPAPGTYQDVSAAFTAELAETLRRFHERAQALGGTAQALPGHAAADVATVRRHGEEAIESERRRRVGELGWLLERLDGADATLAEAATQIATLRDRQRWVRDLLIEAIAETEARRLAAPPATTVARPAVPGPPLLEAPADGIDAAPATAVAAVDADADALSGEGAPAPTTDDASSPTAATPLIARSGADRGRSPGAASWIRRVPAAG